MMYRKIKRNYDNSKRNKHKCSELDQLLKKLQIIDLDTVDNKASIYYQLRECFKCILQVFDLLSMKTSCCAITQFIRYCQRRENYWYQVATPLFDDVFCVRYNSCVKAHRYDREHNVELAVSRIASGMSYNQNTRVHKNVSAKCML